MVGLILDSCRTEYSSGRRKHVPIMQHIRRSFQLSDLRLFVRVPAFAHLPVSGMVGSGA